MARWTILEKNHNHNKGFKVCNYYNVIKLIKQVLQPQSDQHVERSAKCGRICPSVFSFENRLDTFWSELEVKFNFETALARL